MKVTRTSILTGITRTKDLPVAEAQLRQLTGNQHAQWLVPSLSAEERKFVLTGIVPEEWDEQQD